MVLLMALQKLLKEFLEVLFTSAPLIQLGGLVGSPHISLTVCSTKEFVHVPFFGLKHLSPSMCMPRPRLLIQIIGMQSRRYL